MLQLRGVRRLGAALRGPPRESGSEVTAPRSYEVVVVARETWAGGGVVYDPRMVYLYVHPSLQPLKSYAAT